MTANGVGEVFAMRQRVGVLLSEKSRSEVIRRVLGQSSLLGGKLEIDERPDRDARCGRCVSFYS